MENLIDLKYDDRILNSLITYDNNLKFIDKIFAYGTSGFRYDENEMDRLTFRVAIVSCIKSQSLGGLPIGIMITASHNKYTDNGIKIAAEDGSSLSNEWENIYSDIINSKNLYQDLINLNKNIGLTVGETFYNKSTPIINVAYDTRRSSEGLCKILCDCLKIINAKFNLYGLLTTPGLHFLTLINQLAFKNVKYNLDKFYFAPAETYWNFLQGGFKAFNIFYEKFYNSSNNLSSNEDMKYQNEILLDCGSGLAGFVSNNIANIVGDYLKISFINIDFLDYKNLNNLCGAEYVHKEKKIPMNYKLDCKISKNLSFDGDVDRIIYFINEGNSKIKTVDGDHLTCLYALTLRYLINKLSKNLQIRFMDEINLGVLCTAYSNGSFMNYIQDILGFKLLLAKTGVKHLHSKAKHFDLAIYFESNGHGTIFFQENLMNKIEKLNCFIESSKDSQTLELVSIFLSLFNKTVGDSISAFIATECSLKLMNMTIFELYNIYKELESVNLKVIVKDKNIFIPNEEETKLLHPIDVQNYIDQILKENIEHSARCFVRPSGTEDVVRIYSEASSIEIAMDIAKLVSNKILEINI